MIARLQQVTQPWLPALVMLALAACQQAPEPDLPDIAPPAPKPAAAPVAEVIGQGHRLNILGNRDIYLRILWHNELYYVRRDNVRLI